MQSCKEVKGVRVESWKEREKGVSVKSWKDGMDVWRRKGGGRVESWKEGKERKGV